MVRDFNPADCPERRWPDHWTGEMFVERFGGATPFSGPDAARFLEGVASGGHPLSQTPVALPDGATQRRAREAVGLTLQALARVLGIHAPAVEQVEAGERVWFQGMVGHDEGMRVPHRLFGAIFNYLSLSDHQLKEAAKAGTGALPEEVSAR